MASQQDTGAPPAPQGASGPEWTALERSPEFQQLIARRRRFVVPALAVATTLYGGFIVLAAWARDFMGSSIHRGFTVAFAFGLALIITVWAIAWRYARFSNRTLMPMIDRVTGATGDTRAEEAVPVDARAEDPPRGTSGAEL